MPQAMLSAVQKLDLTLHGVQNSVTDFLIENGAISQAKVYNLESDLAARPLRSGTELIDGNWSFANDVMMQSDLTVDGSQTVGGDMTISGNLVVSGDTTTVNTVNMTVNDAMIRLHDSGVHAANDPAPVSLTGMSIYRGQDAMGVEREHAGLVWNEVSGRFVFEFLGANDAAGSSELRVAVAAPTQNDDATTKKYVDDADAFLQGELDAEETARMAADGILQDNIDAEALARLTADNALDTQIAEEVLRATGAENQLAADLAAETSARESADTTITTNLNNEISRATGAETQLASDLAAETSRAEGVEGDLQAELDATQVAILGSNVDATVVWDLSGVTLDNISGSTSMLDAVQLLDQYKFNKVGGYISSTNTLGEDGSGAVWSFIDESMMKVKYEAFDNANQPTIPTQHYYSEVNSGYLYSEYQSRNVDDGGAECFLSNATFDFSAEALQMIHTMESFNLVDSATGISEVSMGAQFQASNSVMYYNVYGVDQAHQNFSVDATGLTFASLDKDNEDAQIGKVIVNEGFVSVFDPDNAVKMPVNPEHLAPKQYVDQAIADLINGAPGALDTLKEIADQLAADESAAAALTNALAQEVSDRTMADSQLQANITSEASTRASADTTLQNNINAEASTRADADTALQGNIDAEALTRASADTTLQGNIDAEALARAAADTTLQGNIDAEALARAAADTTLQNNIDAEAAARDAADVVLQGNIDAEAAARDAADVVLQGNIDTEAATRLAADNALSGRLDVLEAISVYEAFIYVAVGGETSLSKPVGAPAIPDSAKCQVFIDGRKVFRGAGKQFEVAVGGGSITFAALIAGQSVELRYEA